MSRPGRLAGLLGWVRDIVVGGLLCTHPVTSIVALGWIMRRIGPVANAAPPGPDTRSGWLVQAGATGRIERYLGGLARNLRAGIAALLSLVVLTVAFSGPWALAWWFGWDNSFNKGYEQAWIGPVLFLSGTLMFVVIMVHLPMALAHQAATGRWFAALEFGQVRRAVRNSGWDYPGLALLTVFLSLPLFASRGLPVFVEDLVPGFADFAAAEVSALRARLDLWVAGYVFVMVWMLRFVAARCYARAMHRAETPAVRGLGTGVMRMLRLVVVLALWLVLAAQITVAQFLNFSGWAWFQHPAFGLPWIG